MFAGSLRTRLLALTLLLVLPTFFFLFVGNFKRRNSERRIATERARSLAKLAAANESHYVRLARQQLATMGQIPVVLTPDRAVAEKGLKTVRRIVPDFEDFGMIEPDGKLFCDTTGSNTPSFTPDLFKKVTATRDFAASIFYPASATNTPILQFGLPVMTNGAIARILFATLKNSRPSEALTNIALPEGGALTVFDRDANVLARLPDAGKWLGRQSPSNAFIQTIFHRNSDIFESPGLDGVPRLYAVSEVGDRANAILLITVGIPRRDVFAAADHELIVSTVLVLLLAALLLTLAWWYSEHQFIRPAAAITQAAERISGGDLSARARLPSRKSELHRIAQRFDQMAANLQRRQTELEQAHGQILAQNAELERRVADRTKELEAINSELEAFSYSVSHDLRAPLRHMNGFAQLLAKNPKIQDDPKTQRQLAVIIDAAKRMGTLIDDLLSFSRMGRQSLSKMQINSTDMVNEIVAEILAREPERQIEWKIDPLPAVHADSAMLRQVWINLIANAVKYTRQKNPAVIEIKSEQTAAETIFSVKDNGAGFDMAYIDKLFGVFQRLHHEQEFEGTGIGLANVRRVVVRHGGNVWAEGKPGEGATFSFSLPNNPT